ncbi:hypothetical protein GBA52_018820 [Prunus armeniaca]|nr:hypothetical protein GBA52_018820 [Prunus armeniaca]
MIDGYMKCGDVDAAKELFEKHLPSKNVGSWNAMVSGLARCGMLKEARELFDCMSEKDEISWSAMVDGYIKGGCHKEALEIFNEMQKENLLSPRKFILSSVLAACANVGAVDQGKWVHAYIKRNTIKLDAVLGAALLDMYAKCGRLDMAWEERGVKTSPGISMVDIGGMVHEFKVGEGSHPQMKEVYLMLETIIEKLQMEGYSPNSSQVLFDIAEEEKETALQYHSEKLAIAFGVLNTKPGTTIRVTKNLRTCEDCHSAIKIFSKVYERDIIVRDRMRYHHFRNGRCSCKDFW